MIKQSFSIRYSLICVFALVFPVSLFPQTQVLNVPNGLNGIGSSVNSNNVGVGTTSPNTKLHIYNNVMDAPALILQGSTIDSDVSALHYVGLRFDGDYGNATGNYSEIRSYSNLYSYWGSYLTFHTTTASQANTLVERMRILPNGNVGIGTINPGAGLEIFKSNLNEYALILNSSGTGWGSGMLFKNSAGIDYGIYSGSDSKWHFANNSQGIDNIVIDNNGYIGLGTSTPDVKLHLHNTINVSKILLTTTAANSENYQLQQGIDGISNGGFAIKDVTNGINRFVIQYSTGNIGIGVVTPSDRLSVSAGAMTIGAGNNDKATLQGGSGFGSMLRLFYADGTETVRIDGGGNGGISWMNAGNVLIGKTSQLNPAYKLDVNGIIRANEVVVNTTGADFVFDSGYELSDLSEIEKYIDENNHLPGIPSAEEMQKNGMSMSEMQIKLLQKIEELTLYTIKQNNNLEEQEIKNSLLEQRIEQLENIINQLTNKY